MDIQTEYIHFDTEGHNDIINITEEVQGVLSNTDFKEGTITVFCVGSTGAITTVEFEPGLANHDIAEFFESIAPYDYDYKHHGTWGDDNGASHVRSTVTGTSFDVPFQDGEMILGTWQQIVFIDFDTRPRSRKVVVQIKGVK
jgi:secondary thiamine-phosphate synthase enzyme